MPKERQSIEMMDGSQASDIHSEAALDELKREIDVRTRCYDRWVSDGKLSYTEARDRYLRLIRAHQLLCDALDEPEAE